MVFIILYAIAGYQIWWAAIKARQWASASVAARRRCFFAVIPMMVAGAAVALWLPEQINFNRESPGGIFYIYLPCFLAGGFLFFGGIGTGIGAAMARPGAELAS